ncbi:MAG: cbb3-type cytochrome oxidase assembly protein CcoS [Flavobacteriales bacterium]|nr:MAG: cbb3-type cytochrome oxidase assembly protein CcoS [Flavobacteriales bacterium]PIE49755.1 MAG: cbb3-type cytochrome oxidase assembly protein CcoS [Flavobacteriales bacterium]
MDIIFLMIGASVAIAIVFFILFLKSVKTGQYDDLYTPSVRMLFEDEFSGEKKEAKQQPKSNIQ